MKLRNGFLIRIGFWAVVILLMLVGFQYVLPVVLPFVMAFLIAALLDRPIRFLAKRLNGKRVLPAIGLTLLFYLLAAVLFGFLGLRVLMFCVGDGPGAAAVIQEYAGACSGDIVRGSPEPAG